jgi:hypothetical protein
MRTKMEDDRRIFPVAGTAGVGRGNYFAPGAPAGPRDIVVGKAAYVGRFRQ